METNPTCVGHFEIRTRFSGLSSVSSISVVCGTLWK